jgi:hypothetical protein
MASTIEVMSALREIVGRLMSDRRVSNIPKPDSRFSSGYFKRALCYFFRSVFRYAAYPFASSRDFLSVEKFEGLTSISHPSP